jgi:hypothetical protein
MTKARIFTFAAIFMAFALLGIGLAHHFWGRLSSPSPRPASGSPLPDGVQQNILIIHMDDLDRPSPSLISVWVATYAAYERPFVTFKALYPDPLSSQRIIPLSIRFALNEDGAPTQSFLNWLRDQNLDWAAYVLIDQQGIIQLTDYLGSGDLERIIPRHRDQLLQVWEQEAQLMQHLCLRLQSKIPAKAEFPWKDMIPDHLRTDLTFEEAIVLWDQITAEKDALYCEVFGFKQIP